MLFRVPFFETSKGLVSTLSIERRWLTTSSLTGRLTVINIEVTTPASPAWQALARVAGRSVVAAGSVDTGGGGAGGHVWGRMKVRRVYWNVLVY